MESFVIAAAFGLAVGLVLGVGVAELWHRAEDAQQHHTIVEDLCAKLDAITACDAARRHAHPEEETK
jgi:NhaP-type Na+/H+ or K+/H+ antiporter